MSQNLTRKILAEHLVEGRLIPCAALSRGARQTRQEFRPHSQGQSV